MIYHGMPFDEYRAMQGMNASTLVKGNKSMLALKNAMDGTSSQTRAMATGTTVHAMVLEPELFAEKFAVMPAFNLMEENVTAKGDRSTNWGTAFCKQRSQEFLRECQQNGITVVSREDYDIGMRIIEAIGANDAAKEMVANCEKEVVLTGEIGGVVCKARLDLCGDSLISDLKTTSDCSPHAFGRTAANLRYGFRLGFYAALWRQNFSGDPSVHMIAVETAGDFDCCVYDVPEAVLDDGLVQARRLIDRYKECLESGVWPGVDGGDRSLDLWVPNWAMPDDEEELIWS